MKKVVRRKPRLKKLGNGWVLNTDAGNVPANQEFFNRAMGNEVASGEGTQVAVSESREIRKGNNMKKRTMAEDYKTFLNDLNKDEFPKTFTHRNRFNYDIKQLRADPRDKTYEIGQFNIGNRAHSTQNGKNFDRLVKDLEMAGYKKKGEDMKESRVGKTKEIRVLQGNYGYGWDDLIEYEMGDESWRQDMKDYNENEKGVPHRIIHRRVARELEEGKKKMAESKKLTERNLTRAERHNRNMERIFDNWKRENEQIAKFLIDNGVSEEEVEILKQNTGLGGNALDDKLIELGIRDEYWETYHKDYMDRQREINKMIYGESLKENNFHGAFYGRQGSEEDFDLPTEVAYDFYSLVDDDIDIDSDDYNLDDTIANRLSDDYGYTHYGFEYDIDKENETVYVYDIKWDLSESLKARRLKEALRRKKLKENLEDIEKVEDNARETVDMAQASILRSFERTNKLRKRYANRHLEAPKANKTLPKKISLDESLFEEIKK